MKHLILILVFITGCASTNDKLVSYYKDQSTSPEHFHISKIKNLDGSYRAVWYSLDPIKSCFEDAKPTDNIITTAPYNIDFVFKTLFYNHSAMNLKRVEDSTNVNDQFVMEAYEDMRIEYDIAYCENTITTLFRNDSIDLVSYKIKSIKKLEDSSDEKKN